MKIIAAAPQVAVVFATKGGKKRMVKGCVMASVLALALALVAMSGAAMAQTPADAVTQVVLTSGVFPTGTTVVNVAIDGGSITVDLSPEALFGFGDAVSDAYVEAINGALEQWPEFKSIEVTVGGQPLWKYLPPSTQPNYAPVHRMQPMGESNPGLGAQNPLKPPVVSPQSSELTGKLVVLHPSHGAYAGTSDWYRAQRTLCGPNPVTNPPAGLSSYQPSDYYYWTMGFKWPQYYEDDMSPETIRFLYAYCLAAGAATYCSRDLDKTDGNFDAVGYGYPSASFTLPKWMTASKYALQDRGGIPSTVWQTTDVTGESNIDLRARAYYANWLMQTLGYNYTNSVSFSLHSNAATTGSGSTLQSQARGTENYWYNAQYPTEQANSQAFCTATENAVISAIRTQYDGTWAETMYNATTNPVPQEWNTSYGTYRGYKQDGDTNTRWQDRGVKTSNFGEIRECKMPAQLMELLFHDDWKFYPDQAFHQDAIFRSTVAWGMYTGICNFFGVTPKPRMAANVASVSFPQSVKPGQVFNGTICMKNQGQAWTWGNKWVSGVYGPYTVWKLKGETSDQFGGAGTKIQLANDGYYYPGDTATFTVTLIAPSTPGIYTTCWRMLKDDAKGGSFGDIAQAQISVENQISGTVTIPGFVGALRDVTFSIDGGAPITKTLVFSGGVASYTLTTQVSSIQKLSAKTAWTLRQKVNASFDSPVNFTLAGGDLNGTNSINVADYNILLANMNKSAAVADINGDGIVNSVDYSIMKTNWLKAGDPQ